MNQTIEQLQKAVEELQKENGQLRAARDAQTKQIGEQATKISKLQEDMLDMKMAREQDSFDDQLHDRYNFFRDWVLEPAFNAKRGEAKYNGMFTKFQDFLDSLPNPLKLRGLPESERKTMEEKQNKAAEMVKSMGLEADFVKSLKDRVGDRNSRRHVFDHKKLKAPNPDVYIKQVLKGLQDAVSAIPPEFDVASLKPDLLELLKLLSKTSFV